MIKLSKSAGFSLVELMIVVAIMAILAAIAIPSFMRFSMRAKTAEATANLAAIRTSEESYRAENDEYMPAGPTPAVLTGPGASTPRAWTGVAGDGWDDIGFEPDGNVRYSYLVAPGTGGVLSATGGINGPFMASATGDLDENNTAAVYTIDKGVGTYPKAILAPPGEY